MRAEAANAVDLASPARAAAADVRGRIDELLAAGDIAAALRAIEDVVEDVVCEPLNTAEIYADAFLDAACQRAGAASLDALRRGGVAAAPAEHAPVVFIASRLQPSGGHTAVLADIARFAGGPVKILLTGISGRTALTQLDHLFGGIADLAFEVAPRGSHFARLQWLQQRLIALQPETVWLFNHHQDGVAVAAVQPGQGYQLKYLHHGDHHLCLGVTLPFGEHHDPHPMGFRNCRDVLGRADNKYLPMAIPDPAGAQPAAGSRSGPLVTCTVGGRNKIEHAYWPAYPEVIADVLAQTRGVHVHVGRLSAPYRWRIRRALARRGVAATSFRYVPYVRSVAATLRHEQVDLYIASFPYPGARTLVEVMAAGVAVAAHDHSAHAFLGAMDMLPPGSAFWSHPSELLRFIAAQDRPSLQRIGRDARLHYEAYYTPSVMRDALAGDPRAQQIPATAFRHRSDPLAQALRVAGEFTVAGVVRRWALRQARRLRSAVF
ncbi:MAG: hypothetical protein EOO30_03430 [Comamonadaceae bacterium]|nr:MAG: hypothetical protein EOO30_03430 [Comamonadaceae bacterium]